MLREPGITALAVDTRNPQNAFAGTAAGLLLRSDDGGAQLVPVTISRSHSGSRTGRISSRLTQACRVVARACTPAADTSS